MNYDPNYPNGYPPQGQGGYPPQGQPGFPPQGYPYGNGMYPPMGQQGGIPGYPQPGFGYPMQQNPTVAPNTFVTTDLPNHEEEKAKTARRRVYGVLIAVSVVLALLVAWEIVEIILGIAM